MSAEEDQQSQSGYDEQAGGPGAPTPLAALEVCVIDAFHLVAMNAANMVVGRCRTFQARHPAVRRCRL